MQTELLTLIFEEEKKQCPSWAKAEKTAAAQAGSGNIDQSAVSGADLRRDFGGGDGVFQGQTSHGIR